MNKKDLFLTPQQVKQLNDVGQNLSEVRAAFHWTRFVQTQGRPHSHKRVLRMQAADELNRRNPPYGHYTSMKTLSLHELLCIMPWNIVHEGRICGLRLLFDECSVGYEGIPESKNTWINEPKYRAGLLAAVYRTYQWYLSDTKGSGA